MPFMTDQSGKSSKKHHRGKNRGHSGNRSGGHSGGYSGGRRPPKATATLARQVSLDLLDAVMTRGLPLQDSIEAEPRYTKLEPRDRRFCRRLVTIALRHHGEARDVISRHVRTMPKGRNHKAGLILIMAAAELMTGEASPHAVVDQSVRLAHLHGCDHLGGLINAVLRKITPADMPSEPMLNLPPWLREALIADWGEDTATNIAAMMMQPPPLDLRPKQDSDPQELAETLGGVATPHGSVRLNDGMVSSLTGYDEGRWWVQDSAASLPAMLLGAEAGETVVDLCAAPGGKTTQLCAAGADVFAVDAARQRMGRLKENMSRLGFNPQLITADGTGWQPPQPVDRVLIDAPCSATGTIRRRPDILCHQEVPDLSRLNALQHSLLKAAATMLKPGGVCVFATCSILKAEGEAITATPPPGLEPLPISDDEINGFRRHPGTAPHAVRLMPDALELKDNIIQGNDGFFIARFRRIQEG